MSTIQEFTNITTDIISEHIFTLRDSFCGITVIHSGSGYTFDMILEVSNRWWDSTSYSERPDTSFVTLDPTDTPINIDFQSGLSVFRVKITNVVGTISSLSIEAHKI